MIDVVRQIEAIARETGMGRIPAGEGHTVRLRRTYAAGIDDVWDALTDPERISRWFLPVSGDLHVGGRFQLEGNAGGEILACEEPTRFLITWSAMDTGNPSDISEVEVRLAASGDGHTTLELTHTAVLPEEAWPVYGPGAVGVGWDGGLLGLALHLEGGGSVDDPAAWAVSDEGREFYTRSSQAWGAANVAAGADPDVAAQGVANTIAFYTVPPEAAAEEQR